MKNFTKKICAVITLVAMLASLGVCGFASEDGATIRITGYEWSAVADGVATAAVYYTVDGEIGELGATMLTYARGGATGDFTADEDGVYDDEDDTAYADTMEIIGINQGTPVESDDEGVYVVEFAVALSSDISAVDDIKLDYSEDAVILIGGDGVSTPGALLLSAPWEVDSVNWSHGGKVFDSINIAQGSTSEAWLDKIASETIKWIKSADNRTVDAFMNEFDEVADGTITLNSLDLTAVAEPVGGQENKYTVTVTIPAGTMTDEGGQTSGIVSGDGVTFDVEVTAVKNEVDYVWEVVKEPTIDAINIELSEEDYAKTGAELNAAIKAALVKELFGDESELNLVLNVKKADEESTATVAITVEDITVTSVTAGEPMSYEATVEIPAGEYAVEGAEDTLVLDEAIVIAVTGNVTEELGVMYGDLDENGRITAQDAILTMQIFKRTISPTERQEIAGDVDGNGRITAQDAILIMQHFKRTISSFPVED